MPLNRFFPRQVVESGPSRWDWALLPLVLALLVPAGIWIGTNAGASTVPTELRHAAQNLA